MTSASDREMEAALVADGEKLMQLTGEDHGPVFIADAATHTPGPWVVRRSLKPVDGEYDYAISAPGVSVFAEAFGRAADANGTKLPAEANAKLIAAAPDLLAALQSLQPILEEIHANWDAGMKSGKLLIALMDPTLRYRADITAMHAAIAKAGAL